MWFEHYYDIINAIIWEVQTSIIDIDSGVHIKGLGESFDMTQLFLSNGRTGWNWKQDYCQNNNITLIEDSATH